MQLDKTSCICCKWLINGFSSLSSRLFSHNSIIFLLFFHKRMQAIFSHSLVIHDFTFLYKEISLCKGSASRQADSKKNKILCHPIRAVSLSGEAAFVTLTEEIKTASGNEQGLFFSKSKKEQGY